MIEGILIAALSGMCSFAGAWGAMSIKLRWLAADIERAHKRISRLEEPYFARRVPAGPGPDL